MFILLRDDLDLSECKDRFVFKINKSVGIIFSDRANLSRCRDS